MTQQPRLAMSLAAAVTALTMTFAATTRAADAPAPHPILGRWTWTLPGKPCEEVYHFRADHTSVVTSGEEVSESRFELADEPDAQGFYRVTDVITKTNGKTGCDGHPGGTPVGDTATGYLFLHPTRPEMVMCLHASFDSCIGPLRRLPD